MRTLLEELWYGNIFPQEQYEAQHNDIKPLLRLIEQNRNKLSETLTEAQKEILEKYDDVKFFKENSEQFAQVPNVIKRKNEIAEKLKKFLENNF